MLMKNINVVKRANLIKNEVINWRRYLHAHPELSFQEKNTSDFIIKKLESLGITEIKTGIGGYGIVATIEGGDGPVVALRADMDALPIQEETKVDFASTKAGVMHACGHDAHTAMLLGAAKLLVEDAKMGKLEGSVKLLFQPAEEDTDENGLTGAPYILKSGAIDDVKAAIALHVCPWRETGEIQVNKGPSMANIDNFSLDITGAGGHGGYPHQANDPIWITSFVLSGIYSLISRKLNPLEVGTISIGEIHGGSTVNVIPNQVELKGTIRSYTKEIRKQLIEELKMVASVVETFGGKYELTIEEGEPALHNNEEITELVKRTAKSLYPSMQIYEEPFGMGGEDFGFIAERIPSAMAFIGCKLKGELHSPFFEIDENVLPIGVALLTLSAHELLRWR